jgi:hypothetical protein
VGGYPGTFNPPTVAHLAIAEAALNQGGLDAVELVVSRSPLGKAPAVPSFEDRVAVLREVATARPWLSIRVTESRLIAEVAAGYDAVVMGMDKWLQVIDPGWYGGSVEARDTAVAALPRVLLVSRPGSVLAGDLPAGIQPLDIPADHGAVSSTLARAGRVEWMLEEAARFNRRTGAWTDPERYLVARDALIRGEGPATLAQMPDADQPQG